jgi:hypothetical protein
VIVVVVLLVAAVLGAALGIRHLYLRLDRPGGFTCSLRVAHGAMRGLGPTFHAGWAGPQMQDLWWRRIAWPGPGIVLPLDAIRIDRQRPPIGRERLRVPASFAVLPVELEDDVTLELAVPRHRLGTLVALIGGPDGRGRGRGRGGR